MHILYLQAMVLCKVTQVSRTDEAIPIVQILWKNADSPEALSEVDQHQSAQHCAIGEGEHEDSARTKHSTDLGDHSSGILHVLENFGTHDSIETTVNEWKLLAHSEYKRRRNVLRGFVHGSQSWVDADDLIPGVEQRRREEASP
jgi:hypothetical protein